MVITKRLSDTFMELVRIDSVSKEEGRLCAVLQRKLEALGARTEVDDAGDAIGGDTGNLIARLPGDCDAAPLLLSAHMDTVEPGRGVEPVLEKGVFRSAGDTILGADDKCGLAIVLEVLAGLKAGDMRRGPLEIVFSIGEEIGLQGVKHLDFSRLDAAMGFVLDTRNPEAIITRAPALNRLTLSIAGKAAHAGADPEKGINAVALAAQAIAGLTLGRIDDETSANIGTIAGGRATNIVPDSVTVCGEVRSHDRQRLDAVTRQIVAAFQRCVDNEAAKHENNLPKLTADVVQDFDVLQIDRDHPVIALAGQAAANLGRSLTPTSSGGGSDANIFAQHGITAGVLGIGCSGVHTVNERANLDDMRYTTELLLEVIRIHAETNAR